MKQVDRKLLTAVDLADLMMANVVRLLQDRKDDRWRKMSVLHKEFCAPIQAELTGEDAPVLVPSSDQDDLKKQLDETELKLEKTLDELAEFRSVHSRFLKRIKRLLGLKNWPEIHGDFLTGVYLLIETAIPKNKDFRGL